MAIMIKSGEDYDDLEYKVKCIVRTFEDYAKYKEELKKDPKLKKAVMKEIGTLKKAYKSFDEIVEESTSSEIEENQENDELEKGEKYEKEN